MTELGPQDEPRARAEVVRLLERYLVEVVERHHLCPWARSAREGGELAVEILWGTPEVEAWIACAERLLARPATRVAMVVAPELAIEMSALREVRAQVAARLRGIGVAEFHPAAVLDLATPARLVPFVRRSPDPLLQLVPLALIDSVRGPTPAATALAAQAQILGGYAQAPPLDTADRIAATNHARVTASLAELTATLDDIAADRERSYARVGIRARPAPQ